MADCMTKRIFTAIVIAFFALFLSRSQAHAAGDSAGVILTPNNSSLSLPVNAICKDGGSYLFLPSGTQAANIRYDDGDGPENYTTTIDQNIGSLHFFSDDPASRGRSYVHASADHSASAPGHVVLLDEHMNVVYQDLGKDPDTIKGRGNSTWKRYEKKPYQIKLAKKADLLDPAGGQQKAKKWILLANAYDTALVRNQIAYALARGMGLESTPEGKQIDLYYDGEYLGTYYLCEKVEIGNGRLEIDELEDTSDNITGGYLLEIDNYYYKTETYRFSAPGAVMIVIKSPEEPTEEQQAYISAFVKEAMTCVSNGGKNADGDFVLFDYFDRDSLVSYFLITTGLVNTDGYRSSTFLYKPKDEDKLYFGPVWDFDHSMGASGSTKYCETWLLKMIAQDLMDIPEFRREVQTAYLNSFRPLLQGVLAGGKEEAGIASLETLNRTIAPSRAMNYTAWNLRGVNFGGSSSYQNAPQFLKNWLNRRYTWLDKTIPRDDFLTDPFGQNKTPVQEPSSGTEKSEEQAEPKQKKDPVIVAPGKPSVKLTAKKGKLKVAWRAVPGAAGYQIRCQRYQKPKTKKQKTVTGHSVWIKKLKRRKKYTVQVRAYRLDSGKTTYGPWSRKVTIRVK